MLLSDRKLIRFRIFHGQTESVNNPFRLAVKNPKSDQLSNLYKHVKKVYFTSFIVRVIVLLVIYAQSLPDSNPIGSYLV